MALERVYPGTTPLYMLKAFYTFVPFGFEDLAAKCFQFERPHGLYAGGQVHCLYSRFKGDCQRRVCQA